MDIFGVFKLFGGLALFLFGMDVMGKGLEKQAGNKLQVILEKLTESPVKGFALGLAVTAVIQSSSATTVMVIGFINSGLMELRQAIGVIMGANVGTTVTAWILSLSGIEGSNFFLTLLKPSSFSPVLAFIGILLYMAGKTDKKKNVGSILLGFAVLMYGMESMSASVAPLTNVPAFTNLFVLFTNPVLGVLVGALLTGVLQSSSAAIGVLQALSVTGAVTYGNAVPIIMGQNIGTCVTALLSSAGANKNARRAACVHLYFNLIGVVMFLGLFYGVNAFFPFPFMGDSITRVGISVVHTGFNLLATAVMLPFTAQLEKLACVTIPDGKEEGKEEFQLLDERLINTPALAVSRSLKVTGEMADLVQDTLNRSIRLMTSYSENHVKKVLAQEEKIDRYEDVISTYLVHLSSANMTTQDSHLASMLLHTVSDFERIGDHATNIMEQAKKLADKGLKFSDNAYRELATLENAVREITDLTFTAFQRNDVFLASTVEPLEEVIDGLVREMKDRHIRRLQQGLCSVEIGFIHSDLLTNYERIADHCSNIAIAIIEMRQDNLDAHEYLNNLKLKGSKRFAEKYQEYRVKYALDRAEA